MKNFLLGIFLLFLSFPVFPDSEQFATVSINPGITHQYIEGFGTCIIDFTDPPAYFSDPKLYDLAVHDLGMSILRMSFPQEMEERNDDNDPDHFNWPAFNMNYLERRMKIAQEFKKRGVERFVFSTWSPSEFIKTNRSTVQGGHVRMDLYDEYAENIAACILAAKQNWGIDVGAFSIQNELMFIEPYKSCIYNPYTVREAVRALMRKFEKEDITTRIQLPEDMMFFDRMYKYIQPTMQDKETRNFHGDFCTHRQQEWDDVYKWKNAVAPFHRQTWMTETSGHKATWDGAFKLACDMYDYLVGGNMSAWIYWQIADSPESSDYALMIETTPTPKYYASKHFYRWIRPGALRMEASSSNPDLLVAAFRHDPDGSRTIVLINRSESEIKVRLEGENSQDKMRYEIYRSGENENCELKGLLKKNTLVIPARHIVTLYGQNEKYKHGQVKSWPQACNPVAPAGEKIGSFENFEPHADGTIGETVRYKKLGELKKFFSDKDIDMESGNGWTALFWAITAGKTEMVKWLIEQGADINHKAHDGWTPLLAAAAAFVGETSESGETCSKYDVFKIVLDAGPDLNVKTPEGFTPLHVAVMNENLAWMQNSSEGVHRVRDLVESGINVDQSDNTGRTPLHWAAWQAATSNGLYINDTIVHTLLDLGADIHKQDLLGRSPLHYAVEIGYPSIVLALVRAGSDINLKDKAGETPLDIAERMGWSDIMVVLREARIPETEDNRMSGEVHRKGSGLYGIELIKAVREGRVEDVKILLDKGADIWYRDSDGFRAFDRARDNNNKELIRILKAAETEK